MLQENLTRDMRKVNLMGEQTERELMLPNDKKAKEYGGKKKTAATTITNEA